MLLFYIAIALEKALDTLISQAAHVVLAKDNKMAFFLLANNNKRGTTCQFKFFCLRNGQSKGKTCPFYAKH